MWSVLIFFAVISYTNAALSDDDIKAQFVKYVMECSKTHPFEMKELIALQSLQPPKSEEIKCLLACAYKTEGAMNDKGMYDKEHVYKSAEKLIDGDNDKRYINAKKLADICVQINDEKVSDEEKGCERAALLFKCTVANAPKLGFKLN